MAVFSECSIACPSEYQLIDEDSPADMAGLLQDLPDLDICTTSATPSPVLTESQANGSDREVQNPLLCLEQPNSNGACSHSLHADGCHPSANCTSEPLDPANYHSYNIDRVNVAHWDAEDRAMSDGLGIIVPGTCWDQYSLHRPQTFEVLSCGTNRETSRTHSSTSKNRCPECYEAFSRVLDLEEHGRQTKHGAFRCIVCQRGFTRQDALTRHRKVHESLTTQRQYSCTYCRKYNGPKAFKRRDHLRQHLRKMHRVDPDTQPGGSHIQNTSTMDVGSILQAESVSLRSF